MPDIIKIGIAGYGNLARGVEAAVVQSADMALEAVYTRRNPSEVRVHTTGVPVFPLSALEDGQAALDVLILCSGSATDLPEQTPKYAAWYNTVDSFDNHSHIPEHFAAVDATAKKGNQASVISCGWDPGMFSVNRLYANCILPDGADYTFWGRGVSQGHSDAIRRIKGVQDARQYTVPVASAVEKARSGENPVLTTREKHTRECFVTVAPEADTPEEKGRITREIQTMPAYFADYDTTVTFISQETMDREHAALPHGGTVIRTGNTGFDGAHKSVIEYRLTLESNPAFTGAVLAACARACARMHAEGKTGAFTMFDLPPAYLSPQSGEELRAHLL